MNKQEKRVKGARQVSTGILLTIVWILIADKIPFELGLLGYVVSVSTTILGLINLKK